jgi:hypothetical protein
MYVQRAYAVRGVRMQRLATVHAIAALKFFCVQHSVLPMTGFRM